MVQIVYRISYSLCRKASKGISVVILLLFVMPVVSQANPSVDVPMSHWSYDAIEKLAILNLADIADVGVRPVSRIKMAHIIKSAIEKAEDYELDFEWDEQDYLESLLYGLIDEFREELVGIGVNIVAVEDEGPRRYVLSPPEIDVKKVYAKLDPDTAFIKNSDGWKLKDKFNLRLKLTSWARLANFFAISITPGLRYSKEDTDADFEDVHIRFSHPSYNMELAVGRAAMWWGPGFRGTLLLSNNAFPLDTLRFNNIHPFRLPWLFRKIGRFNGQFFVSRLEEKRAVPEPWLCGWRVDYTPWQFLKFGFGHILMFGGKGVKKLGFSNFWSSASLVFSAAGGGTETENHIISGDIQLFIRRIDRFLPIATGLKLYTEWGAEDEAGNRPIDLASVTGAYFTDVFKIPGFDGKIEFARLNRIWYDHFRYTSGYTRRGNFIGHHLGPDSEEIAVTGIFSAPDQYKMSATFSHQRRGLNKSNVENTNELRLEFSVQDALEVYNIPNVEVSLFYELQDIEHYNNTINTARNHILGVEVRRKF